MISRSGSTENIPLMHHIDGYPDYVVHSHPHPHNVIILDDVYVSPPTRAGPLHDPYFRAVYYGPTYEEATSANTAMWSICCCILLILVLFFVIAASIPRHDPATTTNAGTCCTRYYCRGFGIFRRCTGEKFCPCVLVKDGRNTIQLSSNVTSIIVENPKG